MDNEQQKRQGSDTNIPEPKRRRQDEEENGNTTSEEFAAILHETLRGMIRPFGPGVGDIPAIRTNRNSNSIFSWGSSGVTYGVNEDTVVNDTLGLNQNARRANRLASSAATENDANNNTEAENATGDDDAVTSSGLTNTISSGANWNFSNSSTINQRTGGHSRFTVGVDDNDGESGHDPNSSNTGNSSSTHFAATSRTDVSSTNSSPAGNNPEGSQNNEGLFSSNSNRPIIPRFRYYLTTQAFPEPTPVAVREAANALLPTVQCTREMYRGWKKGYAIYQCNGVKFRITERRNYSGWWTVQDHRSLEFNLTDARRGDRRFSYDINEDVGTVLVEATIDDNTFEIEFMLPAHVRADGNLEVKETEQKVTITFPK